MFKLKIFMFCIHKQSMNKKLTYHYYKIINIIQSCETQDHLFSAKTIVNNFIKYWVYHKINNEVLNIYVKYFTILIKHKHNNILGYD